MLIWAVAATAAAVVFALIWILYRRQVKKTCRQLAFLKEQKTNMRLTADLPFPELNELTDGVNSVLDLSREMRQEAQKNETDLKETITNLSHDIRTPLTSLDGYFQLLIQSESEEERLRYIEIIKARIGSLKEMLEELFTYTKLQDAEYELETECVDFGKCVYDTVFSFYDEFQKKGIEPEVDFCDGHLMVAGNEEAVRRSVQNLIRNALVHGQSRIRLELSGQEGCAIFRCANDTEHPEEIDPDQVFRRFYKADSARTHTSTGLGLSIAKGLVERMGGEIRAWMEGDIFSVEIRIRLSDSAENGYMQ